MCLAVESTVTLAGQPQGWPVSLCSGIPTPVSVTTIERRNSYGDLFTCTRRLPMATIPTVVHPIFCSDNYNEFIAAPLPTSGDLFVVADFCAALVSCLVESDNNFVKFKLCERLTQALKRLQELCAEDLPDHLIEKLTTKNLEPLNVPDCWQDTDMLVTYSQALAQALSKCAMPTSINRELTGLLHDLIYLLVDYLMTPFIVRK